VLADPISDGLNLSRSWFFGIFSAALLLSGLLGPLAGRLIDRHGGRDVLAATNLVFAAGLALLATATGPIGLVGGWLLLGAGMGFGLYEAAFATVTGLYGSKARSAITGITLFAGFASTVGWPLSAFFNDAFGWRGACLAWAGLHLLIGLPLNRFLVPKTFLTVHATVAAPPKTGNVPWTMIVLAAVFGATTFIAAAVSAHLPRMLEALGTTPTAAVALGALIGPAQVTARVIEFTLLRQASPMLSAQLAAAMQLLAAILLVTLGAPVAAAFVILYGGGNGLLTIARGTLPLALFGPAGYGLRTGILAAPARILQGGAPLAFGLVLDHGGSGSALILLAALAGSSLVALLLLRSSS
jgi:MFS family permease